MLAVEHKLDVVKVADYIIDLGKEGGGQVLATGTPEEIIKSKNGYTAEYLRDVLKKVTMTVY